MGTDNPKVSAYVPQVLKDRLKQFTEEHSLSESQAVTTILGQYFGIAPALGRLSEGLLAKGVTLAQMEVFEVKLASLTEFVESRFRQLEETISNLGGLPVVQEVEAIIINNAPVAPLNEPLNELSSELLAQPDEHHDSEPINLEKLNSGGLLSEQEEKITVLDNVENIKGSFLTQENIQNTNGDQQENTGNEENQVELLELNMEEIDRPTLSLLGDVEARQVINSASEPMSKLQDELLTEPEAIQKEDDSAKQLSITDETDILLLGDRQPDELESQHQVSETEIGKLPKNLLSGLPVELTLQELASRLGTTAGTLNTKKHKCNGDIEKFYNWLQTKDPDEIRWIESGSRGRNKLYKPSNTSDELLSGLKE